MSSTTNFLIGPIKEGLRKDQKPWSTPEDSFDTLINAYQFRGRIVRRDGYRKLGVLANGTPVMGLKTQEQFGINQQTLIAFDTTNAYEWNGTAFIALPSVMTTVWSGTDSQFFFTTNYANAFWATNSKPGLHGVSISGITNAVNPLAQVTTSTPHGFTTGQTVVFINVGGMVQINGQSDTITVTGANTFTLNTINTSAYGVYTSGGFALNSSVSITGQDGIRFYGILSNGTGWANYNPPVDPFTALAGALLIFPYRGYLVFLNTSEGSSNASINNYPNRARWTQIGTPYYSPPQPTFPNLQGVDVNAARDDLFGRGGASDAPTNESIVAAGFIRDILVVYFTRSTWRLRFVNNAQNPFVWERVNIELGSECTFSTIPFDKGLMAIGNRGIVISDGNDTARFDEKIPDQIFQIRESNQGFNRVQGIRTFETKLNLWTIPSDTNSTGIYPDQVLVFNYETKNWSTFDDVFTTFGYLYPLETVMGQTWGDLTDKWSSYGTLTWDSGVGSAGFETIVAGNQQGYIFELEQDSVENDPSLSISAITAANPGVFSSTNNNIPDGTWISLVGVTGITSSDGVSLNGRNFKLNNPGVDPNNFTLKEFQPIGAGNAIGAQFLYTIAYKTIIRGSLQINVGTTLIFSDPLLNGNLTEASGLGNGSINYSTGNLILNFTPSIGSSAVNIRLVTYDPNQGLMPVSTLGGGAYAGGGEIIKISNFDIVSKIFNFFPQDQRARLSKIDFYTNSTTNGQLTCNVFADSSDIAVNTPLSDNLQSNVILTSTSPYQVQGGDQTVFRLYCDAIAQTLQVELTMSDQQQAVTIINETDFELLAMSVSMRRGGRLP